MSSKAITDEEQKQLILDMLDLIDKRCREKGYTYWLFWGTLLGVIRHKGMIPWDDDIDIAMPREDYERFIEDINTNPLAANIHFVDNAHPVKAFYPSAFGKVCRSDTVIKYPSYGEKYEMEVSIDVFPMDGVSEIESERLELSDRLDKLSDNINRCVYMPAKDGRSVFRYGLALLRRNCRLAFLYEKWIREKTKLIEGYKRFASSKYCGFPSNINIRGRRLVFERQWFETIYMEFEGKMMPVPAGYDDILEIVFPNYMELPPVEERVSHHDYTSVEWR